MEKPGHSNLNSGEDGMNSVADVYSSIVTKMSSAAERGSKSAMAIFKSSHSAAKYFVWLVSGGSRSIDWSLFPEMEP